MDAQKIIALNREIEDLAAKVSRAEGARDALQAQLLQEEEALRQAGVNVDDLGGEIEHMEIELDEALKDIRQRLTVMGVIGG